MSLAIKIVSNGKITPFKETTLKLAEGDEVLIENMGCQEKAIVCELPVEGAEEEVASDIEPPEITRRFTDADRKRYEELKKEATSFIPECSNRIEAHNLEMVVLDAELSLDEKKLTFFFSAPGRVDFRALVSDLASTFRKLIRLQQVGARDQARFLDGVGRCGNRYCCRSFLKKNLPEVTLDMARCQQLAHMGSNRITGSCGKLMCCLRYELKEYQDKLKHLPSLGESVKIKEGKGTVISLDVLQGKVGVLVEGGSRVEVDWSK